MVMRDSNKTIGDLLDKQSIVYMSAINEDGFPTIKAMGIPRIREGIKTFYFSTNTSSQKIGLYQKNNKASVYFLDRRFFRGVNLFGTTEILTDREIKEEAWQNGDERFYPEGIDDPDYCILKFTALSGRYFSGGKSEDFDVV